MYSEPSDRQFSLFGISNLRRCWQWGFLNAAPLRQELRRVRCQIKLHRSDQIPRFSWRYDPQDSLRELCRAYPPNQELHGKNGSRCSTEAIPSSESAFRQRFSTPAASVPYRNKPPSQRLLQTFESVANRFRQQK